MFATAEKSRASFGRLLFLKLANLTALTFDLALLVLDLTLLLSRHIFLALQGTAHDVSCTRTQRAANRGTRQRMADCGPDYGPRARPEYAACHCTFTAG
jgi:hypothetical protein